jgi:hypothetical protein
MSYDWFLIAKREHLLAPEVPELKINVCAGLRVSAAENLFNRRRTQTDADLFPGRLGRPKTACPSGWWVQRHSAMCLISYDPPREAIAGFIRTGRSDERFM